MVQKEIVGRFHNGWLACSAPGHLYKNLHKNLIPHLRALWWYVHVCIPPNYFPFSHSFSLSIIFFSLFLCSVHLSVHPYISLSLSSIFILLSLSLSLSLTMAVLFYLAYITVGLLLLLHVCSNCLLISTMINIRNVNNACTKYCLQCILFQLLGWKNPITALEHFWCFPIVTQIYWCLPI